MEGIFKLKYAFVFSIISFGCVYGVNGRNKFEFNKIEIMYCTEWRKEEDVYAGKRNENIFAIKDGNFVNFAS